MTCRVLAFDGVRVAAVGVAVEGVPVETLAVDGVAVAGVAVDGVAIGVAAASLDTGGAAGTCALLDGVLSHRVLAVVLDEDERFDRGLERRLRDSASARLASVTRRTPAGPGVGVSKTAPSSPSKACARMLDARRASCSCDRCESAVSRRSPLLLATGVQPDPRLPEPFGGIYDLRNFE